MKVYVTAAEFQDVVETINRLRLDSADKEFTAVVRRLASG
jgi:hypothetical protein